ncbi:MAG: carboxypeptidase regulatory-like domain-containing protein [Thermoplasmata archaeon]
MVEIANTFSQKSNDAAKYLIGWWQRHGWISILLLATFLLGLFIRIYFSYPLVQQYGPLYLYSGGSDSYYHDRVMEYVILYHHSLILDTMLNYPIGLINPRAPIFDWMNAILGILLSGFFGGNAIKAGAYVLSMSSAFWGSMIVFPVYLIGKEIAGKKTGILSAMIITFMAADVTRTMVTFSNYLGYYLFVLTFVTYFYIVLLRSLHHKRYVEKYSKFSDFKNGVVSFYKGNKKALDYTLLTGVGIGVSAMSWQGYTYLLALVYIFLIAQMLINLFRGVDSFDLYVSTTIAYGIGFLISFPYYYGVHLIPYWFDLPFYLYLGATVVLGIMVVMRDKPWLLTLITEAILIAIAAITLYYVKRPYFNAVITGQGYFVKTQVYSTVAEAQAPDFSVYLLSFGIATFFMSFVGLVLIIWKYIKKLRYEHLLIIVLGLLGAYVAISAGKFIFLGTTSFAILSGYTLYFMLDRANFEELRRTFSGFKGTGFYAIKKSVKPIHVLIVIFIVFILVIPNVWYSIDASIPYQLENKYNAQVYKALPSFLHPPGYTLNNSTSWYFGAFPYSVDEPNQYYPAAYLWLAQQNLNLPPAQRPAFMSWWDYGFQAVDEGKHPVVADNFQDGYQIAGSVLMAQNQSSVIALLVARLLQGSYQNNGNKLPSNVVSILERYKLNVSFVESVLANPGNYINTVLSRPDIYGPYASYLHPMNAEYAMLRVYFTDHLSNSSLVWFYHDIRQATGYNIEYFAVDSRMFPFSGTNTGIFYAPAKLSDQVMGGQGGSIPIDYYNILAVSNLGVTYPLNDIPQNVQIVNYQIQYEPMFYNSFLYREFVGYDGAQLGLTQGIPTLSSSMSSYQPEPGWNMTHFELVYRTAYWNPYKDYQNHSNAWTAVSYQQALKYEVEGKGTSDLSGQSYLYNGVSILEYYDGAYVNGTVTMPNGAPVSNIRVTVFDQFQIPHQTTLTNSKGQYSLIVPPGNDTIVVSSGGSYNPLTQLEATILNKTYLYVGNSQAMRIGQYNITNNVVIPPSSIHGLMYFNDANELSYNSTVDVPIANTMIHIYNSSKGISYYTNTTLDGSFSIQDILPYQYNISAKIDDQIIGLGTAKVPFNQSYLYNIPVTPSHIYGKVLYQNNTVSGAQVRIMSPSGYSVTTTTNSTGYFSFVNIVGSTSYYNISVNYKNYYSIQEPIYIGYGKNITGYNISLYPSSKIYFEVYYDGVPAPYAYTRIESINLTQNWLIQGSSGNILLPIGNYVAYTYSYINGKVYTSLLTFNTATQSVIKIDLHKSAAVYGTLYQGSLKNYQSSLPILVSTNSLSIEFYSNSSGFYSIYLPIGKYSLKILHGSTVSSLVGIYNINLNSSTLLNINMSSGISLPFKVSWNSKNESGALRAYINVSYQNGNADYMTNFSGISTVGLPLSNYYNISVSSYGFQTYNENISFTQLSLNKYMNITLTPIASIVSINTFNAQNKEIYYSIHSIKGYPYNETTIAGQSYNVQLYPGVYKIYSYTSPNITNPNVILMSNVSTLVIPIGTHSASLSLNLIKFVNVHVSIGSKAMNGAIEFSGIVNKTISINNTEYIYTTLMPGEYSVYLYANLVNGMGVSLITNISVSDNQSNFVFNATNYPASVVNAKIIGNSYNKVINVTLQTTSGIKFTVSSTNNFTMLLPVNQMFYVRVNQTEIINNTYEILYTYNGELSTSTGVTEYSIVLGTSMIKQKVTIYLNPQLNNPENGYINISNSTNILYSYPISGNKKSIYLLPGLYNIYLTETSGIYTYVNISKIDVSYSNYTFNLTPEMGWKAILNVKAPVNSSNLPINSIFKTESASIPFKLVTGYNSLYLPDGIYNVSVNTFNYEYNQMVKYNAYQNLSINNHTTTYYISLSRVAVYGLSIHGYTNNYIYVKPGSTFSYSFKVMNTGNVPSEYSFSGVPAGWGFKFSPSTAFLNWMGTNSTMVNVLVTVPKDAQVQHPQVMIIASSLNSSVSASALLNVNIVPIYNFSVSIINNQISYDGSAITIPFYINNNGNTYDNYSISLVDSSIVSTDGWNYSFDLKGTSEYTGYLSSGSNQTYNLKLTPMVNKPILPSKIIIGVQSTKDPSMVLYATSSLKVAYISLNTTAKVTAPFIGAPPSPPNYTLYVWAAVVAVVIIIAIIGANTWRSIKRKRFY